MTSFPIPRVVISSPLNNETVMPSDEYQVSSKLGPGNNARIPDNPLDFSKNITDNALGLFDDDQSDLLRYSKNNELLQK